MNTLNYASLEASKRLVESGIVLGIDAMWLKSDYTGEYFVAIPQCKDILSGIPAPSMVEVWREFGDDVYLTRHWNREDRVYKTRATLTCLMSPAYTEKNPTDALIDLLIWIKGMKERS
jgi:hypothetical protein